MNNKDLLTPLEFAFKVKVAVNTVYAHINSGKIKAEKKQRGLRKVTLIPKEELDKYLELENKKPQP